MSYALHLAVAVSPPLIIIATLAVVVATIIVVIRRASSRKKTTLASWDAAADELGIRFVPNGSNLGPIVRGRVNYHVVSISPGTNGTKRQRVTRYSVKFDAPEAPDFNLMTRVNSLMPIIDTGNREFDAVVSIQTEQPKLMHDFLTDRRRAAILQLLTHFPAARITNTEAHLLTVGIEQEKEKLVDAICHLVASAEMFDTAMSADNGETTTDVLDGEISPTDVDSVALTETEPPANPEGSLLTDLRLDEASVLSDLFNSALDNAAIDKRFEITYEGLEVKWTGEVLSVGGSEGGIQRVVAFVGSVDGMSPESGRVVAMTSLKSEPRVVPGDVVSFSGALVNLDLAQRLFHVV